MTRCYPFDIYLPNHYLYRREQFKQPTKGSWFWSGARPPFPHQWKNWEMRGTKGCIVKNGKGRQTTINWDGIFPGQRPSKLKWSQTLSTTPRLQEPHPRQIFVRAKWQSQFPAAVDVSQSSANPGSDPADSYTRSGEIGRLLLQAILKCLSGKCKMTKWL